MSDYNIKFTTEADTKALKDLAHQTKQVGQAAKEAKDGHDRAAEATGKHGEASGKLIQSLKVLNGELGRIPVLGEAIHVLRHPFTWLAMAIGITIEKLREAWEEVEKFSASARAMEQFKLSTTSVRTEMLELRNAAALMMEEVERQATRMKTASEEVHLTALIRAVAMAVQPTHPQHPAFGG